MADNAGNGRNRSGGAGARTNRLSHTYRGAPTRPGAARPDPTPWVIGILLALVLGPLMLAGVAYAELTRDLPSLAAIHERRASFQTAQVFDRHGTLLWEFNDPEGGTRTVVPLRDMSPHLISATLAAEDATFYEHQGFDALAIARSAWLTLSGEGRTGASTIPQQLVRNVIMDPEEARQATIRRKLREIILAYQLDQRFSKDQILEMYLNEVYYGNQAYGVEAASLGYFGKRARDLNLAEAALLAGLVQSPSNYDPTRTDVPRGEHGLPEATRERQKYVLDNMVKYDFISQAQADEALAQRLEIRERQVELKAPHWVMYVRTLIEQKYGDRLLYQGGLKIYTTLDYDYQQRMQEVLAGARQNIVEHGGNNAALIAVNPRTGEILAFNGSMDYHDKAIDGQVNVLLNERQPGSAIKPVVYAASFLRGWSPGRFVDDTPECWQDRPGHEWCPRNFDGTFNGQMTARTALGNSINIPAVKALEHAGLEVAANLATAMGITTWGEQSGKHLGLSLTLGGAEVRPIDLAQVYATFANNGKRIPLVAIRRVATGDGRVLEDYGRVPEGAQILDPRAAYMITDILADPKAKLYTYGANTTLVLDRPAAVKTGTTDNFRDTWTAGYTPNLAIVVWVGNTGGRPMKDGLSSMTAGNIWPEAMQASFQHLNLPAEEFQRPGGMVEAQVCGDRAMRPGEPECRQDLFFEGQAPEQARPAPPGGASAPAPARPALLPQQRRSDEPAPEQTPAEQLAQQPTRESQPAPPQEQPTPQPVPAQPAPTPQPSTQLTPEVPAPEPTPAPAPEQQPKPDAQPREGEPKPQAPTPESSSELKVNPTFTTWMPGPRPTAQP